MTRALLAALTLCAASAFAICTPSPTNPENDCDEDGCTVSGGDCADRPELNPLASSIRGQSCNNGAAAEVCDGADNNCNGSTDENNPGGGLNCTSSAPGVCRPGTTACVSGAVACRSNVAVGSRTESCNNQDDDCDGATDEGVPTVGNACTSSNPGVCAAGTLTCNGTAVVCVSTVMPGTRTETCNAQDDDCDSQTDEGFNVGTTCNHPTNVGVCRPGLFQCQGAVSVCVSTVQPNSRTESCNNQDDDCDGATDEDIPGLGTSCTSTSPGVCAPGTQTCTLGVAACSPTVAPGSRTELCNNQDDDCDGVTDDGFPVGATCTSTAMGICSPGHQRCQSNGTILCTPDITPGSRTETCNNQDDDCDGSTDENIAGIGTSCTSSSPGVCAPGTQTCTLGVAACSPNVTPGSRTETCNNQDDNCDGSTDEGLGLGTTCTASGVGRCATGSLVCNGSGGTMCQGRTAVSETCNGVDDNCNGTTDDSPTDIGGNCTVSANSGVCRAGVYQCPTGASSRSCVATIMPGTRTEGCNGLDDDCDGMTDEGYNVNSSCSPGTGTGRCATGVTRCVADAGSCVALTAVGETCNAVDDDCDGMTDEGNPGGGGSCSTGLFGVCGAGTQVCNGTGFICRQTQDAGTEICNGSDDDCDNQTDEGFNVGTSCTVDGGVGRCATGSIACSGGAAVCQGRTQTGESCNNQDDDCDGMTDENNPGGGASCSTGLMGVCGAGTRTCSGGTLSCVANIGSTTEVCDNADNDCDGMTDEGFDVDGDSYKSCSGCGLTTNCDCDDTRANVRPNQSELCDALDNNCNGQTDEGSGVGMKITRNCYSGATGTSGKGQCVSGVQTCNATVAGMSSYGSCMNEVVPTAEVCNRLDDDCDGATDEDFDVDNDGFNACSACASMANCDCNDTNPAIKPGATETCDNVDQNCDGRLDDVPSRKCFAGANVTPDTYTGTCPGPTCNPRGACESGTQMCTTAGAWSACTNAVLPTNDPTMDELTCNGLDDDCDGATDDGNFDKDMDGVRSCAMDCDDNDPQVKPGLPEVCDNKDNNCDGTTDGNSTACYSGPPATRLKGVCRDGTQTCTAGMGSGACAGERVPALLADGGVPRFELDGGANDPETLCNSQDDDCDGVVDDGFDLDGDGVTTCAGDCNDADPFNRPGLAEFCDCQDNNCNGSTDEGSSSSAPGACYGAPCHDFDGDGFTNCQGDCDDTPGSGDAINPRQSERRGNSIDDDCDGAVDEDTDEDGDGYSTGQNDCDDRVASINPAAIEVCDGFDNDCDGTIDEGFDQDNDRVTTCQGDCDDMDLTRSPRRAEVCGNGRDDNCDGRVDEDLDQDGDGVTTCQGDCNDFNAAVHPAAGGVMAAEEVCDGQNNACSSNPRYDAPFDVDGDGYATCFGDCNDANRDVNPGTFESPGNSIDDDCDGQTDEGSADVDNDGYSPFCGDCNDADPAIHPRAMERCDRVDNDCDALVDATPGRFDLCQVCFDADMDGQTNCDGDCNDADRTIFRGAPELCDLKDNDCDSDTDLDPVTGLRVCTDTPDGGPDGGPGTGGGGGGGGLAGGGSGGAGGSDATGGGTGEPGDPGLVRTGCGCSSGSDLVPFALAASAFVAARRRRSTSRPTSGAGQAQRVGRHLSSLSLMAVLSVAALTAATGCQTAFSTPEKPDGGGPIVDGDGGTMPDGGGEPDGGKDGGAFIADWKCPTLYPAQIEIAYLPGPIEARRGFAHGLQYSVTHFTNVKVITFDDRPKGFAGFVLERDVPADIDLSRADALETFAARELASLRTLQGTPLVQDTNERFTRIYEVTFGTAQNPRIQRNYSYATGITFATATDPFSVRNRLVPQLSGRTATEVGQLPVDPAAGIQNQLVVYTLVRLTADKLYIAAGVSRLDDFTQNQPALNDFGNGSHLSEANPLRNYICETVQSPPLKTDFIFVVDNSESMAEEQAALANASDALFETFSRSGIDFRLGVITTDSDVLRGSGFTNQLDTFKQNVRVGLRGNPNEMGAEFALRAIRRAKMMNVSEAFKIRDDAGLVIIVLSDEHDLLLRPVSEYATDFNAERGVVFGIVGPNPTGCQRVGLGKAAPGSEYIDLAARTGGSTGSICNPNIAEVAEEILFGAIGASSRTKLGARPISGSLAAEVDLVQVPRARANGFDYDPLTNTLLFFGVSPAMGGNVTAAYATFEYIE